MYLYKHSSLKIKITVKHPTDKIISAFHKSKITVEMTKTGRFNKVRDELDVAKVDF